VLPQDLKFTAEHEWIRLTGDVVRVGITDFAQEALGDIVFVTLPEPGTELAAGSVFGEVESTKSVSDLYAPVSGTVSARNEELDRRPELVNSDPYGEGWMIEITPSGEGDIEGLLDSDGYTALITPSS